jgi:hypothetical protein
MSRAMEQCRCRVTRARNSYGAALALFVACLLAGGALAQQNPERTRIETELITVYPHGFEPGRIERRAGPCFLAIDNKSGIKELTIRLDRVGGGRLKEAKTKKDKYRLREILDLTPGQYLLTEQDRPTWKCEIVITAR